MPSKTIPYKINLDRFEIFVGGMSIGNAVVIHNPEHTGPSIHIVPGDPIVPAVVVVREYDDLKLFTKEVE